MRQMSEDQIRFENSEFKFKGLDNDAWEEWGKDYIPFSAYADDTITLGSSDMVNSPAHYTRGSQEAIDIIEEAIKDAPTVKQGFLQAQVLKYLLRLWLKVDSKEDAEKARWYLDRLIKSL